MVTSKFDTSSKLHLNFPEKNKPLNVVSNVETAIEYEQSRPPEEQLPHTPKLVELRQQWTEWDHKRLAGETQRAAAAEKVEKLDQEMIEQVRRMRKILDATFPDMPTQAIAWGFKVKQSTKNILLPRTRQQHLVLLDKYIAKEQSRPEAERFTSPDLAEITRIRDELRSQLALRLAGQTQREEAVVAGSEVIANMYNYLQAVAVHLLTFQFDFKLTVELQNWGYDVVLRRPTIVEKTTPDEEAEAAPETVTAAAPADGTSTNGSANGTAKLTEEQADRGWE